jgi:hypothetical protein
MANLAKIGMGAGLKVLGVGFQAFWGLFFVK